jgi:hypothetical protein
MPCGQCATADSLRTHGPEPASEPLLIRPRPLSSGYNNNAPATSSGDSRADKGVRQHSSLPRLDGRRPVRLFGGEAQQVPTRSAARELKPEVRLKLKFKLRECKLCNYLKYPVAVDDAFSQVLARRGPTPNVSNCFFQVAIY